MLTCTDGYIPFDLDFKGCRIQITDGEEALWSIEGLVSQLLPSSREVKVNRFVKDHEHQWQIKFAELFPHIDVPEVTSKRCPVQGTWRTGRGDNSTPFYAVPTKMFFSIVTWAAESSRSPKNRIASLNVMKGLIDRVCSVTVCYQAEPKLTFPLGPIKFNTKIRPGAFVDLAVARVWWARDAATAESFQYLDSVWRQLQHSNWALDQPVPWTTGSMEFPTVGTFAVALSLCERIQTDELLYVLINQVANLACENIHLLYQLQPDDQIPESIRTTSATKFEMLRSGWESMKDVPSSLYDKLFKDCEGGIYRVLKDM